MQILAQHLGGSVLAQSRREYGDERIEVEGANALFAGTPAVQRVWMSHGDHVEVAPAGFRVLAKTGDGTIAAIGDEERALFGMQFHPEVSHSEMGMQLLQNFVRTLCDVQGNWDRGSFIEEQFESIRSTVGRRRVLCAVSGGVDSTVMAVLVARAVGEQLTAVFVDNGLLRDGEVEFVTTRLRQLLGPQVLTIDARERFLSALQGIEDPELKRKTIGRVFVEVFEDVALERGPFDFLAQGTLYPDRIESLAVRGASHVIKTHHNVGGLPENLGFTLVEPLAELFKDEVRAVGAELGIPSELLLRHPFPGPGLAVRCLGEVTPDKLVLLRAADHIFLDELRASDQYDQIWQAGCVLLPVRSVGVMGDARTYESAVALRAVTSRDAMTADWARIPDEILARISNRIVREVPGINRVVLDITSKPPSTIEWE